MEFSIYIFDFARFIYISHTIFFLMFINLCCFLQEVATKVVQKLQPREASTLFIEVKSKDQCIYPILQCYTLDVQTNQSNFKFTLYRINIYTYMPHCIIILNSLKLRTPSPFKSNCLIIDLHSSMDLDSPIFLSILLKLLGVINQQLSVSYMSKQYLSVTKEIGSLCNAYNFCLGTVQLLFRTY